MDKGILWHVRVCFRSKSGRLHSGWFETVVKDVGQSKAEVLGSDNLVKSFGRRNKIPVSKVRERYSFVELERIKAL